MGPRLAYRNCLGIICFLALIAIVGIIIVVFIVAIIIDTFSHTHDVIGFAIIVTLAVNCIVYVHCAGGSIGIIGALSCCAHKRFHVQRAFRIMSIC